MIESKQPIDPAQMDKLLSSSVGGKRMDRDLKVAGLIVIFVAPGVAVLGLFLSALSAKALLPLLGAAALILFVGIGLLVAARVSERWYQEEETAPPVPLDPLGLARGAVRVPRPQDYSDAPEALIVGLAKVGDRDAFAELVRRRQSWIRNLKRRLSGAAPLRSAAYLLTQGLTLSLVEMENRLLAPILAPLNNLAIIFALGLFGLRLAYRRIFR